MDRRWKTTLLIAATTHFVIQVALLLFAPWDYTPGQPEELWPIAQRWNWVGAIVSFPLVTFSVYFPFECLEQFIGKFAPVSWITFCLIDSLLWGAAISFAVACVDRRRQHGSHSSSIEGIGANRTESSS